MDLILEILFALAEPAHLLALLTGVFLGLVIGVIPGLGGVFGLAILIPATYGLDPTTAIILLLAMVSVTTTSDTIPAVLMGIPGTVGSAATVLDGHALAKRNQAAQALGAAYSASMIGGLFGAILLAVSIPFLRPLVLFLNYGDLFAITVFGLSLVAMLSGNDPRKGILMVLFGALVAFTGLDPFEGVERWSFGEVYFWDGIPSTIVFLGLFGVSELADLLQRGRVADPVAKPDRNGLRLGIRATLANGGLVLRSGAMGSLLGAVPGIGVTVIEWIAYGSAARREKKGVPFGEGNIRGVIAPESANNAKEGGSLLPTIGFGIPGSTVMAMLMGAFILHGIVPGPEMIERHMPLLGMMIATIAIANIIATGVCLSLTGLLARIALVPATILVPPALIFLATGAFQANRMALDLVMLIAFGILGLVLKRLSWPRPAFALGFVLAPNLERFFFLSYQISGWAWLLQPVVVIMFSLVAVGLLRDIRQMSSDRITTPPPNRSEGVFLIFLLGAFLVCLLSTIGMPFASRAFPQIAAPLALLVGLFLLKNVRWSQTSDVSWFTSQRDLVFLAQLAALCLLLVLFGQIAAAVCFIAASAILRRDPSAKVVLGMIAFVAGTLFLMFGASPPIR